MIGYEYIDSRGKIVFVQYPEKYCGMLIHSLAYANDIAMSGINEKALAVQNSEHNLVVVKRKDNEVTSFMIDLVHGVSGYLTVQNGKVIDATEMHRYMIGWNGKQVRNECRRKKWQLRKEKS